MRLARAQRDDRVVLGAIEGDHLAILAPRRDGGDGLDPGREGVLAIVGGQPTGEVIPLGELRLLAPVPRPGKVICVGANYRAHAAEAGVATPAFPEIFAKFANTIIGPGEPIPASGPDPAIDWEGELAVVIGRRVRDLSFADALSAVAGYMVANDISARTWQTRVSQWVTGKSFDGFCPIGPHLATPEEVGDPQALRLVTRLNGEVVQDASTEAMVFPVSELVAYLSSVMTLEPGDLILTGTPEGVGLHRSPPRFLRDGDTISVEVERVGVLENPVKV